MSNGNVKNVNTAESRAVRNIVNNYSTEEHFMNTIMTLDRDIVY